jgi:hypothetical protein
VVWAVGLRFVVVVALLLGASVSGALAQTTNTSAIEGRVTDDTGGVLPGVTVTISSPALQAPQLLAVTDAEGRYRFTALPAGVYSAIFQLTGFRTLRREELRLTAGFVATIDVSMSLGQVEESVTVSGQSPVVDIRTTTRATSVTKELLEAIPTSLSAQETMKLIPGIRVLGVPDVGGSNVTEGTAGFRIYGARRGGNAALIDGIDQHYYSGEIGLGYMDMLSFEEVQVTATGQDAEVAVPGAVFRGIIQSGGNQFHGQGRAFFESDKLQSNNVNDFLRSQGVGRGEALKKFHDISGSLGGRIFRDRLWFFGAAHGQGRTKERIGYIKSAGLDGLYGTGDDVPGEDVANQTSYTGKLTAQLTTNQRMNGFLQRTEIHRPENGASAFRPFENTTDYHFPTPAGKVEWTYTPSNRSVVNFLFGRAWYAADYQANSDLPSSYDAVTLQYRGISAAGRPLTLIEPRVRARNHVQYTGSYSYYLENFLRGSHQFKIGGEVAYESNANRVPLRPGDAGDFRLTFQNGVPFEVELFNTPITAQENALGRTAYVKDSWKLGERLTLNLGIRAERYQLYLPDQRKQAGPYSSAASYPETPLYVFQGLAPRAAFSYALTTNGKTVIKGTYGRFNFIIDPFDGQILNTNGLATTTYRWADLNGNRTFDAGELGDFVESLRGDTHAARNRDLKGPYTREWTVSLERELIADLAVSGAYIYKREYDRYQRINVARPYSAFTIPITRTDPGPDGLTGTSDDGGPITYYDYDPAFRGPAFEELMYVNTPGYSDRYHNVELGATKRLSRNWQMLASYLLTKRDAWQAGSSTGEGIPESPNAAIFPKLQVWDRMFKISGSYLLPYGVQFAAYYGYATGEPRARDVRFTSGLRQLTNVIVRAEPLGAQRYPSSHIVTMRAEKRVKLPRGGTVAFQADVANALNADTATGIVSRSGPTYGRITTIVPPRIVGLGVTYSF